MTEETVEDERDEELSSIQAIFPELTIHSGEPRKATLELQVAPSTKLPVTFDPPNAATRIYSLPTPPHSDGGGGEVLALGARPVAVAETHLLEYLPSLCLELVLKFTYPDKEPPNVKLLVEHAWLPREIQERLEAEALALWEEYGRSQVVYSYIDFLQQEAERGFGLQDSPLRLPHELKTLLLDYDRRTRRQRFDMGTFDCGVCLEPKKGSSCYKLTNCGHVFCISCLQDFYNSAITEGDVSSVKCLAPDCGKLPNSNRRKPQRTLHPRELLDIPLERTQVQRYVDMKLKKRLESDKNAIFCPRKWCQAPARSAKYAKYNTADLENYPSDDEQEDQTDPSAADPEDPSAPQEPNYDPNDRLSICSSPKCQYAFCRVCLKSWHGDLLSCRPPNSSLSHMSAEELASYDYIRLNTSPCPTCNSPAQKSHGCNHMICATCSTHFCYLCSSWLPGGNPYKHFNTAGTSCYQRLWELEEGDEGGHPAGEAPGGVFGGPRAAAQALEFAAMVEREHERLQEPAPEQVQPNPPIAQAQPAIAQPQRHNRVAIPPQAPIPRAREARPIDRGLQRFLELAANDEEDGWDSDEMEEVVQFAANLS